MSAPSDRELMQLHDDELSEQAASELLERVGEDERARAVLEGLSQIGDVVRALALDRVASTDLTEGILARIDASGNAASPLVVLEGGAPPVSPTPASKWSVIGVSAAALAAAAAAAFLIGRSDAPTAPVFSAGVAASAPRLATSRPVAPRAVGAEAAQGVAPAAFIEAVDFGMSNGTIFVVSGAQEDDTPVVWVTDEPTTL